MPHAQQASQQDALPLVEDVGEVAHLAVAEWVRNVGTSV